MRKTISGISNNQYSGIRNQEEDGGVRSSEPTLRKGREGWGTPKFICGWHNGKPREILASLGMTRFA